MICHSSMNIYFNNSLHTIIENDFHTFITYQFSLISNLLLRFTLFIHQFQNAARRTNGAVMCKQHKHSYFSNSLLILQKMVCTHSLHYYKHNFCRFYEFILDYLRNCDNSERPTRKCKQCSNCKTAAIQTVYVYNSS